MTRSSESHDPGDHDFPYLSEFARGYLHQDLIPEHGTALQATVAYLSDLSPADRKNVADEAFRLRAVAKGLSSAEINHLMAKLGASWSFVSKDELEQVLQTLERGH